MEFESWRGRSNEIELIEKAVQQLLKSKRHSLSKSLDHNHHHDVDGDDHEDAHLLAMLLSQLEALKAEGVGKKGREKEEEEEEESRREDGVEKQLKKLERQNRTTHWLLSALILITAVWQLSQVSLLFKLKYRVTHPFNSFASFFSGFFKPPKDDHKPSTSVDAGAENRLKFARDVQTLILNDDQH